MSLNRFLTRLIWVCVFPLILLAVYLAIASVRKTQSEIDVVANDMAIDSAASIDNYLIARIYAMNVMAESPLAADPSRRKEFYEEAQAFRRNFGSDVILADTQMRMLFNTRAPLGATLPALPRPKGHSAVQAVLETGKPAVGDLFVGPIANSSLVAIAVPGLREGKIDFLILASFETRAFQSLIEKVELPPGWSLALFDGNSAAIAGRVPEGLNSATDVDSAGRFIGKSAVSPWSVVVEIPRTIHRAPLIYAATALTIAVLGATLVGVIGGKVAGRRLAKSVASLAESPTPGAPLPDIEEIATVRRLLDDGAERRQKADDRIRRLNRVYAVLSGINALIVRVRDKDELFRESCRIAVDHGKFHIAWIGVLNRDLNRLDLAALYGEKPEFLETLRRRDWLGTDGSANRPAVGRVLIEKKAVFSNDIQTDPQIRYANDHMAQGTRSLAVLPLMIADSVMGVLCLHARETGFFDDDEKRLLLELAGDISFALDHIEKEAKLDYLAYYDSVTGLANRTLFHERLAQGLTVAGREGRKLALIILDIERFKTINDTLGRQAGDTLLKQIADRMAGYASDIAWLARIGADHFAIMAPDIQNVDDLPRLTERRLDAFFGPPFRIGETELRIAAKLGIAVFPGDGANADTLFKNAEAALKKAKASGDRYLFYTQAMNERVAERMALENKLRQALEKDEFVLHYQPKVDLETRNIVGVEALIRWQSPELGLVPPMKFIPLMEETGLILPVGSWALKRASLDHRGWVNQGLKAPRVAVNVSPIQLRQRDFVGSVEQAIIEGVAPTGIDLEITESLIMEDIQGNIEKLKSVRQFGVQIAIDDFGTGYSSLGYLAKLPVQTLKIDRSFIITMLNDPGAMTLVQTMISLAHSLKLKVVAEGVDAEEQAKILRLLRCDEMQGYLFSRPIPFDQMTALLKQGHKA